MWAKALNTRSMAPFDVAYNRPLPAPFVALVTELITAPDPLTPAPEPTIGSPLPKPAP